MSLSHGTMGLLQNHQVKFVLTTLVRDHAKQIYYTKYAQHTNEMIELFVSIVQNHAFHYNFQRPKKLLLLEPLLRDIYFKYGK